jgi:hypothetical protein
MKRSFNGGRSRAFYRAWFHWLNAFADNGLRTLTRSQLATYLVVLRQTRSDGVARVGLADLARCGGMSRSAAIRAVHALVARGVLHVVRPSVGGKPALYSIFPADVLARLNPAVGQWMTTASTGTNGHHISSTGATQEGSTDAKTVCTGATHP